MTTLNSLPNELIEIITDLLDNRSLISLHSASGELRSLSDAAFKKRLCRNVCIEVSLASLEKWSHLLPRGDVLPWAETLILSPAHVPEILDEHWFGEERDGFECPCSYDLDQFRLLQKCTDYVDALEEQRHLLRSGRFVSHVVDMLACLPNLRQIKIEDRFRARLSVDKPFICAISNAVDKVMGKRCIAGPLRVLSPFSSSHECRRAACQIMQDLASLQCADRCRNVAAALLRKLTSSGGADERRLMVKAWGDSEAADSRWPTSVVGPGFRTASTTMPGSRDFLRSLVSALVEIRAGCNNRARKPGVSIGRQSVAVDPDYLPSSRASDDGVGGTTCDAESLSLVLRWPAARYWFENRMQAVAMQPPLQSFLQHFPNLTELTVSSPNLGIATSLGVIKTLKKLTISRARCHAADLSDMINPDQWQNLEALSLIRIDVSEGRYRMPEGETERAFLRKKWAGKVDGDVLDEASRYDQGVWSHGAWSRLLRRVEALPALRFFKLSGPIMWSDLGPVGTDDGGDDGDEEDDYDFYHDPDVWGVEEKVVTRDTGQPWHGRLSAIADLILH